MGDSLYYKLHSGKPNKLVNFTLGFLRASLPSPLFRIRLKAVYFVRWNIATIVIISSAAWTITFASTDPSNSL